MRHASPTWCVTHCNNQQPDLLLLHGTNWGLLNVRLLTGTSKLPKHIHFLYPFIFVVISFVLKLNKTFCSSVTHNFMHSGWISGFIIGRFSFSFFLSFKFVFFIWYCYHVVTKFLSIFVSFFRMQWFSHITNRVPRSDNQATWRPSQDVHLENQCAFISEDCFLL